MGDARRRVGAVTELDRLGRRRVEEVQGHRGGRGSRPGVTGQAALHQLDQACRLAVDDVGERGAQGRQEWGAAGEPEPCQRAEAVDVGGRRRRLTQHHLRGHEALGRVEHLGQLAEERGHAEVAHHRPALPGEEDVAG